jgi:putative metallohydrolase (TIGR04338 family)
MPNALRPGQARDNQRQRLYDAEDAIRDLRVSRTATKHLVDTQHVAGWGVIEDGKSVQMKCPTVAATQAYVDAVTSAAWFQSRWGRRKITVVAGRGSHGAYGEITVSQVHRRSEVVILHEIAHCLTGYHHAHHGPEFAGVLLTLVRYQMGKTHADTLRASFKAKRVRYTMADVPKPGHPVVTQAERSRQAAAAKRQEKAQAESQREAAQRRLVGYTARHQAAEAIRANVKAGRFGPSGSKPRTHALATARALEAS